MSLVAVPSAFKGSRIELSLMGSIILGVLIDPFHSRAHLRGLRLFLKVPQNDGLVGL